MATKLVSVVIPIFNESDCLSKLHQELRNTCDQLPYDFEFIFVDDGSKDRTAQVLTSLRQADPRVCYLILSRNFGHQAALSAGLDAARGDAVIMMDGDLQHPPQVIPDLLGKWEAGFDIVNTLRLRTEKISPLKKYLSSLFYKIFNWVSHMKIDPGTADFRLISRQAVDVLNDLPERSRFLRGLVPWLGFRQTTVEFMAPQRWAGRSKYNIFKNFRLALDGLTAFSFYPLRKLTVLGWLIASLSILYMVYALTMHLFAEATVPGWTSLLVCVLFFGGIHLFTTGIMSEYIGRILEEVKGRPNYIVRKEEGTAPNLARPITRLPAKKAS